MWLDDGTPPPHDCLLPTIAAWSTGRPQEGFCASDGGDESRHIYPGARWQCHCDAIHKLNDDGEWVRE